MTSSATIDVYTTTVGYRRCSCMRLELDTIPTHENKNEIDLIAIFDIEREWNSIRYRNTKNVIDTLSIFDRSSSIWYRYTKKRTDTVSIFDIERELSSI